MNKCYLIFFLIPAMLIGKPTIEDKRESLKKAEEGGVAFGSLSELNEDLLRLKSDLKEKGSQAFTLFSQGAEEEKYKTLLEEINVIRDAIVSIEDQWRVHCTEGLQGEEGYAFWDQEETTLSQLVLEYGSNEYLYVVPSDIASLKLHVHSTLPIPRESWNELLERILSHNGIGIKEVTPFVKQLYVLKQDLAAVKIVVSDRKLLRLLDKGTRVAYIFSPPPEKGRGVGAFFERFRDPKTTFVYPAGTKIALVAGKEEVEKLLALYDAIWESSGEKITRVVTLAKVGAKEMEKILQSYFNISTSKSRLPLHRGEEEGLTLFPISQDRALMLIGTKELVLQAEKVAFETENQIKDPHEMTIYWYSCRHSDPIELSDVLEKVYYSLVTNRLEGDSPSSQSGGGAQAEAVINQLPTPPNNLYPPPPISPPVINPPLVTAGNIESQKERSNSLNFIPDPKSGSIMMVVRRDKLDKLKGLLKKLDKPKKMVEIEVLLFEKKVTNQNNFGLNLLRLGSDASKTSRSGANFDGALTSPRRGILEFFISQRKVNDVIPAFDFVYNFLMNQEDARINTAPSVKTLNQTPAEIALVEEISINNGAAPINSNENVTFQRSFSRAQYGTTIVVTPTIHEREEEERSHFITLETNVTFDTTRSRVDDRPNVDRRQIKNQVRVMDGETLILGGLRRKTTTDRTEKIPFLGEIPGIAKFFGTEELSDQMTEMFVFITPRLVLDKTEEREKMREEELKRRAGDIPDFLKRVQEGKSRKKTALFADSFKLLFGKPGT